MNDPESIWQSAERAVVSGDAATLEALLREHGPKFREQSPQSSWLSGLAPNYSSLDARSIIIREHHFANWTDHERHAEAVRAADSQAARFEVAVDAVVAGDEKALKQLLQRSPELVQARSTRTHRSTLLHYVGANGVEGWRQRTPANAVQIARVLLGAGADVDAPADMYGGGATTLGLIATSIHPLLAGVQNSLMDVLLEHGALLDHPTAAGNQQSIVNGCLANGRQTAAEYLAQRGARLDLEGAAGVGWLEQVESFFDESGDLKPPATQAQLKSGFQWACEYGRASVVEFLLRRGVQVDEIHRGQTGLHWASYGGHLGIVEMLLAHGASVHLKDESWQNTPLGWAVHGWANPPPDAEVTRYHEVIAKLVAAGSKVNDAWLASEKVRSDARMLAALRGEMQANQFFP